MKEKFLNNIPDEQETTINIVYPQSYVQIYTSKRKVYERLHNKLGEPLKKYYLDKKVCGASWKIPFSDKKKLASALSRPLLIGNIK